MVMHFEGENPNVRGNMKKEKEKNAESTTCLIISNTPMIMIISIGWLSNHIMLALIGRM